MQSRVLPLLGAAAIGFATAVACLTLWSPRPAGAQLPTLQTFQPPLGLANSGQQGTALPPQPIELRNLDADHFVMATREPRLVAKTSGQGQGTVQNMLVTVVVHYTVRGDHLIPVEHVRVPAGYKVVSLDE